MLDIFSTHKISRPVYEGGLTINMAPKGSWKVEVRRTDGTIRYPYGDRWIDNLFLNQFADGLFSTNTGTGGFRCGAGTFGPLVTFLYGNRSPDNSRISIGTSSAAVVATQTSLQAFSKNSVNVQSTGNSATVSPTTGDIVFTTRRGFAAEVGPATYNEAGILAAGNSGGGPLAIVANGTMLINRVVFPSPLSVTTGEVIILTCAITIPTLAVNAKTVTIAAQNGMNISGQLKVIGTTAILCGGTITADGTVTSNPSSLIIPALPGFAPFGGLMTATSFPAFGSNTTGLDANSTVGTGTTTYTVGSRIKDLNMTWSIGSPVADTAFRSIGISMQGAGGAYGYQLLLDNQMTKQALAALSLSLRFSV